MWCLFDVAIVEKSRKAREEWCVAVVGGGALSKRRGIHSPLKEADDEEV